MDNEQESKIVISVDKQAANESLKAIKALDDAHKKLGDSVGKLDAPLADNAATLKKVNRESQSAASAMQEVSDAASKQNAEIKAATSAAYDYEASLKSVKASGADLSGDLASSFGGIRGAASAVGLGAVTDVPLGIAEAAADFGEFLPRLKVGLEASAAGGTGLVSTLSGLAAGALPAAGAGFGAIAIALAPIALVAGAVVGAFALLNNVLDTASKNAARQAENQTLANEATNELLGRGATTGGALEASVQLAEDIRVAELNLQDAIESYDAYLARRGGNLFQGLGDAINVYGDEEQVLADAVTNARNNFEQLTTSYNELIGTIQEGEFAANDLAAQEASLADLRETNAAEALAAQQEAERAAAASAQRVAALQEQIASLNENRAIQEASAAETNALERSFAYQDEKAETAAHYQALADIQREGQARIEAIQSELNQLPIQQAQALAEIQAQGNEKLKATQDEYFKSQIEATRDFAKSQARIASDTAKTAKRLAEDIADNLADAARSNDVVAFLKIQRDGQKDLKRNAEDAKEAEKRATEDFIAAQEKERNAFNEKQAAILRGIADEKQKQVQAFAEKRAALEQQIQQERANTQQALNNAKARYEQSEALEAQAAQRDAQRLALRQQQEEAAFQRQISAIQSRISSENSLYSTISAGLSRVSAQAAALGSSSAKSSSYSKYPATTPPGGAGYKDSYGKGSFSTKSSGATVNNFNATITAGDIATASQVSSALEQLTDQFIGMINGGIAEAQN